MTSTLTTTPDPGRETRGQTPRADRLRTLNLPLPVTVELDDNGRPAAVFSSRCRSTAPPLRQSPDEGEWSRTQEGHGERKTIDSQIETWRVDDEWWREPISRRYVEVVLEGGKHAVLYEDLIANNWFMQMP